MASKSVLISRVSNLPVRRLFECPPAFLAPALASSRGQCLASKFSTSGPSHTRKKRNNKERGVSPMRRTGLNMPLWRMSVGQEVKERGLPVPVDKDKRSKLVVDPEHGLWGFFNADKELLTSPVKSLQHGREWYMHELRGKSWEDLHVLWWKCVKERNRIHTEMNELSRLKAQKGSYTLHINETSVRKTQRNIKAALTERWYAWEKAWNMAQTDPTIDLEAGLENRGKRIYRPPEDEMFDPVNTSERTNRAI